VYGTTPNNLSPGLSRAWHLDWRQSRTLRAARERAVAKGHPWQPPVQLPARSQAGTRKRRSAEPGNASREVERNTATRGKLRGHSNIMVMGDVRHLRWPQAERQTQRVPGFCVSGVGFTPVQAPSVPLVLCTS